MTLTVEDLHDTLADDRHLGYGYSYCEHLPLGQRVRVDRAIVAVANELGLDHETLFHWSNSKYGRWLYDAIYGRGEPPTRKTVRGLLNAEAVEAATEDVAAPLRQTARRTPTRKVLYDRLGRLMDDLHQEARALDAPDGHGAVPADYRAAADYVAELRKDVE